MDRFFNNKAPIVITPIISRSDGCGKSIIKLESQERVYMKTGLLELKEINVHILSKLSLVCRFVCKILTNFLFSLG